MYEELQPLKATSACTPHLRIEQNQNQKQTFVIRAHENIRIFPFTFHIVSFCSISFIYQNSIYLTSITNQM